MTEKGARIKIDEYKGLLGKIKGLLAALCDNIEMEIADAVQITPFGFPKGELDVPIIELGRTKQSDWRDILLNGILPGCEENFFPKLNDMKILNNTLEMKR